MKPTYKIALAFVVGALLSAVVVLWQKPQLVTGSTVQGNDYYATTTRNFAGTALTNLTVLKSSGGAVARVTITGANTGIIRLWDATTTNVNLRSGATTTLSYIEIPASAAANTYDFDATFNNGVIYELVSGLAPTSTLMYR